MVAVVVAVGGWEGGVLRARRRTPWSGFWFGLVWKGSARWTGGGRRREGGGEEGGVDDAPRTPPPTLHQYSSSFHDTPPSPPPLLPLHPSPPNFSIFHVPPPLPNTFPHFPRLFFPCFLLPKVDPAITCTSFYTPSSSLSKYFCRFSFAVASIC